jgi:hypothetical protein
MRIFASQLLFAAALLSAAVPLFAHHSFSAEYDIDKPVTLKGTLTRIDWINPHGWIAIDVKGPDGKVENWSVEFGSPSALLHRGLRKTDFSLGIEVTVKGYQAKSGKPVVNGVSVTLPDGRNLYTGSSGNGGPAGE